MDEIETAAVKANVRVVLEAFDKRVFIRDTAHDGEAGWFLRVMPAIAALAELQKWATA